MANNIIALVLLICCAQLAITRRSFDPACSSCPSKNCTYTERLDCKCTGVNRTIEILDPSGRDYANISLGFVIDNTGSMAREIAGVRTNIQAVVTETSTLFNKYVIGTFGDPYVRNVLGSTDVAVINNFVGSISARGGGDCPEMALNGIYDVAARLSPGSPVFLFTDASSKNLTLEPALTALLTSKDIRLNILATSTNLCGSESGEEYTRLTAASNGTMYQTWRKSDVDIMMNYIKKFAKFGTRFIRVMPKTLEDLKEITRGNCTCATSVDNLVCTPLPNKPIARCPCPKGYKPIRIKKKICHLSHCQRQGSLGFLVDATSTMRGKKMAAVRSAIASLMARNTLFKDYVASRFGDPYVKKVVRSSKRKTIMAFVKATSPKGGGDCPDFAMSAIRDAANMARKHSVLVLFTDAAAKDAAQLAKVKALLLAKQTRLFVVKLGKFCGPGVYKGEFDNLAVSTGGVVVELASKASAAKVGRSLFKRITASLRRVPVRVIFCSKASPRWKMTLRGTLHLVQCKQSSVRRGGACRMAIDRKTKRNNCARCARTLAKKNSWWLASIKKKAAVKFVRIYFPRGKASGCSQNIRSVKVTVGRKKCTLIDNAGGVATYFCNAKCDSIRVASSSKSGLTVCEVQAFGSYTARRPARPGKKKKSAPKPHKLSRCSQSSVVGGGHCHKAIDGRRRQGECAKISAQRGAWWQAKTGGKVRIGTVIVHQPKLQGVSTRQLQVSIDGRQCKWIRGKAGGASGFFKCNKVGNLVRVSTGPRKIPLSVCEVVVLAWQN